MKRYTHKLILQPCDFSNFGNDTSHISSSKYKRPHREIFPHSHTRLNFAQYDTHKKRKSFWRKKMWQKIKPKIFSHHPSGSWFITSSLFKKLQNKSWYFSLIVTPMNVWNKLMAKDVLNCRIHTNKVSSCMHTNTNTWICRKICDDRNINYMVLHL